MLSWLIKLLQYIKLDKRLKLKLTRKTKKMLKTMRTYKPIVIKANRTVLRYSDCFKK